MGRAVARRSHLHEVKQSAGPEAAGCELGRPGPLLLETKLHVPTPSPAFVPRPHLLALLDAGAGRQLTLVQAPTGFGKTTLLAAWCASVRHDRPCAWVSLGSDDNDPLRLWTYLIEALHRSIRPSARVRRRRCGLLGQPPRRRASPAAQRTGRPGPSGGPGARRLPGAGEPGMPSLGRVPHRTPSQDRAARHVDPLQPPLALGRLRARGQLLELQGADLRFTGEETAALLNDRLQLNLDPADLAILHDRTEGWARGPAARRAHPQGPSQSPHPGQELLRQPPARHRLPRGRAAGRAATTAPRVPAPHVAP